MSKETICVKLLGSINNEQSKLDANDLWTSVFWEYVDLNPSFFVIAENELMFNKDISDNYCAITINASVICSLGELPDSFFI